MKQLRLVMLFGILQLIFVDNAFAYIDLSVGSMLIQAVIVGLVSIGIFWRRSLSFLRRLFGRNKEAD